VNGAWVATADIINASVAAWVAGDGAANTRASLLDSLNNRECTPGVDYRYITPPSGCASY